MSNTKKVQPKKSKSESALGKISAAFSRKNKASPKKAQQPQTQKLRIIGHEKIYEPQTVLAEQVLDLLMGNQRPEVQNKRTPIIMMQPQCGKTGVIVATVESFIGLCRSMGWTFQIIIITGLSHTELTKQTRGRLFRTQHGMVSCGAGLDVLARSTGLAIYPEEYQHLNESGIMVTNNVPALRKMNLNMGGLDVRLVLIDEVHIGNGRDGNIDTFLRNHGIRVDEQPRHWDHSQTVNHLVGVSATPFAHVLMSENLKGLEGPATCEVVYHEPPENYNSMKKMLANGRLRETGDLCHKNGKVTDFLKGVLAEFDEICDARGPGLLVIRAIGKKHPPVLDFIRRAGNIECKQFDEQGQNLDQLNNFLGTKPEVRVIVLIRGSHRAGMTLPDENYIYGWVESTTVATDTQLQAGVGRACGYGGKETDTYPIYCNLDHVKKGVEFYDKAAAGTLPPSPSGVKNKSVRYTEVHALKKVHPCPSDYVFDQIRESLKEAYPGLGRKNYQISTTAGTVYNDTAAFALSLKSDNSSTLAYRINGPTTKEATRKYIQKLIKEGKPKAEAERIGWGCYAKNRKSYEKLLRVHPEWENTVIELDLTYKVKVPTADLNRNNLQKKSSATRKL
jgi:hypothetical protein